MRQLIIRRNAKLGVDRMADISGPDKFAPPERRGSKPLNDSNLVTLLRDQQSKANPVAENLTTMIQHVAGDSIEEIDRVIRMLEGLRDMMRTEGERISREIAGYASLSHASTTAMRVIADSVKQWKEASDKSDHR